MEEDLEGGAATFVMTGREATLRVPSSGRGPLRLTLRRVDPGSLTVSVEAFAGARSLGLLTPSAISRELMVLLVPEDVATSAGSFDLTLLSSIASPSASRLRLPWIRVES